MGLPKIAGHGTCMRVSFVVQEETCPSLIMCVTISGLSRVLSTPALPNSMAPSRAD